ncbi:glycosyltransferase [Luteolibacter sp. Populi]|uniref:glycosyltransferase family 4 protein n=1 Tax=Luteolibacter sp. Populi TaxID=3230487 RepID=UPI0034654611
MSRERSQTRHLGINPQTRSKIAFLGTYIPRRCGIATFTADLVAAVAADLPDTEMLVAAMNAPNATVAYPPEVRFNIDETDASSHGKAASLINASGANLLCVQHEFGIFGGPAGSYLLTLLRELRMPVVTTLHSILATPDVEQRKVMDELTRRSSRLVVMAETGATILRDVYEVDAAKIDVIPHGIPDFALLDSGPEKEQMGFAGRKILLTFGLLGRGKGIEYAIRALPEIVRDHPEVLYVVLGATHPNLVASEGERYRESLGELAEELGVGPNVRFEDCYVTLGELEHYMAAADIYLTPYPNEAQITSGTLAQAIGAGKVVVSTPYLHAQELLAGGKGVLVASRDSAAITAAVNRLFDHPQEMETIRAAAYQEGRNMIWPAVAARYRQSFARALADSERVTAFPGWKSRGLPVLRLEHLSRMTDGTGLFQHAIYDVPLYKEGYCTDDNARGLILCNQLDASEDADPGTLERMSTVYLAFLADAFNPGNGRFRNFMSHGRVWLEGAGSEDSHGRALWAAATGAASMRKDGRRLLCGELLEAGMGAVESFTSPRAWAFTLLGLHEYLKTFPGDMRAHRLRIGLVDRLIGLWDRHSSGEWQWYERSLSYDNARLPQALIASGSRLPESRALEIGLASLEWLVGVQTSGAGHFRPIGNEGFYPSGGKRADFDQQPLEAQASVAACLEAWRVTGDKRWLGEAERAFDWFLGRNDVGLPLYDPEGGGCCDGLQPDRVNANQGAESSLAFALSLVDLRQALAASRPSIQQIA